MPVSEQERILSGIFPEMRNPLNLLPIYKKPVIRALKSPSIQAGSPGNPERVRRFFQTEKK
jgi:hypothetical protein